MPLRARHIMREKLAVGQDTTVKDAVHRIISSGQPGLPVVSDKMEVIGIITEFNVLGAIREGMDLGEIPVARIMSKEPTVADINISINDLIQMMLLENFTIVPIVNNNRYVGVVSRHMIMDAYLSPQYYLFLNEDRKGPFLCK